MEFKRHSSGKAAQTSVRATAQVAHVISCISALARSHVWWFGIDNNVEATAKNALCAWPTLRILKNKHCNRGLCCTRRESVCISTSLDN